MSRIYSESTAGVTNYETFAAWHAAHEPGHNVPSRESVIKRETLFVHFDAEKDCFYRIMGRYSPVPGERQDISWRDVAENYASMYADFAVYGTN